MIFHDFVMPTKTSAVSRLGTDEREVETAWQWVRIFMKGPSPEAYGLRPPRAETVKLRASARSELDLRVMQITLEQCFAARLRSSEQLRAWSRNH